MNSNFSIVCDMRNQYDTDNCLERGLSAQDQFVSLALKSGYSVTPASDIQDMHEHWDYLIQRKTPIKVEVKGRKKISRSDSNVQDCYTWIELDGVRDSGWLYGAKSDFIAFEKERSFIFVKRESLINKIKELNITEEATSSDDALYKIYTRRGRFDKLTMIETKILDEIKSLEWEIC